MAPPACHLSYIAYPILCGTAANKENVEIMAADRMRLGVTIHFRTWFPYLTLLPTRENFMMQDFPTTLYKNLNLQKQPRCNNCLLITMIE